MPSLHKFASAPLLEQIYAAVEQDFTRLNQLIPRRLTSDVDMVEEIGRYIVESGGKRLRPLLVLLAARCCSYQGAKHITLAAVIEFLHTATLLHDDVIDHSDLRRGRATVNALWGNSPSVLVGDFLYSRAFQMMVEIGDMRIMDILSGATNVIAEGEVMQLDQAGDPGTSEERYREVIRAKTAMLFQAAAHTAAVLSGRDGPEDCAPPDRCCGTSDLHRSYCCVEGEPGHETPLCHSNGDCPSTAPNCCPVVEEDWFEEPVTVFSGCSQAACP